MLKPHDIFNSEEQIRKLDKQIAAADQVTAFIGSFLITSLILYLIWQYFIR